MKSMTGYGKVSWEQGNCCIEVEIRCFNGKTFKLTTKFPPELGCYETEIKKIVNQSILRGSIFLTITHQDETTSTHCIQEALLIQYYKQLLAISCKLQTAPPSLDALLRLPGVVETTLPSCFPEEKWEKLKLLIQESIQNLEKMRIQEGIYLEKEILQYIENMEKQVSVLEAKIPLLVSSYKTRLTAKLEELASNKNFQFTENDILREVAILSDRIDISEEITRLKSHFQQFRQVAKSENDVGKKLEFLLQEILRESNTIASKANDAESTNIVIELKASIEKIREQIQNVE